MLVLVLLLCCPAASAEQCRCPGDVNNDTQVDLEDLQAVAGILLDAGSPFVVPCDAGDCVDINSDGQIDLEDLQATAAILLEAGSPFVIPCSIPMVWVTINDPGVPDHEGFTGQMSKYETTNAQYCRYLNSAKVDGLITVYDNSVYAVIDTSYSQVYFDTYDADSDSQITYSDGAFSVRSRDGYSMSNHPVVEVSWYGATAFCDYYGYRLPTEWEWQAVADYDGSFTYGCGTTINQSKANHYLGGGNWCNPLGLSSTPYTSPVDHYLSYGYGMNDMAGNVWEWTSSCYNTDCSLDYRVLRGGSWYFFASYCTVSRRHYTDPYTTGNVIGFRVCR